MYANLEVKAQDWLAYTGSNIMERLKSEPRNLRDNKNNPSLLPAYAFDPQESLEMLISVPHALLAAATQGLWVRCKNDLLHVMFPNRPRDTGTGTIENLIFDLFMQ